MHALLSLEPNFNHVQVCDSYVHPNVHCQHLKILQESSCFFWSPRSYNKTRVLVAEEPWSLGGEGGNRPHTIDRRLVDRYWYTNSIAILYLLTGAEEACWAHNPKVLGSKPRWARFGDIAFVPERSKGLDSSSSVFVLVGSSPTECIIFSDSEVVITVDFESTIRSSNLRRRMMISFILPFWSTAFWAHLLGMHDISKSKRSRHWYLGL